VLSFGGTTATEELSRLRRGTRVSSTWRMTRLKVSLVPGRGALHPGSAGLLVREGRSVEDWDLETFAKGFAGKPPSPP
jgi:pantothenate synthetase